MMSLKKSAAFEMGMCSRCGRLKPANPIRRCNPSVSKLECPLKGKFLKPGTKGYKELKGIDILKTQINLF
jgi:hypothetical protein